MAMDTPNRTLDRTLDPGRMTARLDLQTAIDSPDGQGGAATSFVVIGSVWTMIEPETALASDHRDEALVDITHSLWIRYRTDVFSGMRLSKGGRVFEIRAAFDPDETRRYLVCRCRETGR